MRLKAMPLASLLFVEGPGLVLLFLFPQFARWLHVLHRRLATTSRTGTLRKGAISRAATAAAIYRLIGGFVPDLHLAHVLIS